MQMNACALDFTLTPAIERHIEDRVALAINHTPQAVNDIAVRLSDINGTRGGVDKVCRIVALLRDRATVVVQAVHQDLYAAVDAAAAKLKEAVRRRTRRRRTLRREHALRRAGRAAV